MRETFVRLADVRKTSLINQNLLQDESGNRLGELTARLHDPQAERNDLCRQEEVDHLLLISLD